MKTVLLIIFAIFSLVACTPETLQRVETIEKKDMVLVTFDQSLLTPCRLSKPPEVDYYINSNRDQKEALLTEYIGLMILYNKECTIDKRTIKKMYDSQKVEVDKFNASETERIQQLSDKLNGGPK